MQTEARRLHLISAREDIGPGAPWLVLQRAEAQHGQSGGLPSAAHHGQPGGPRGLDASTPAAHSGTEGEESAGRWERRDS